MNNINQKYYAGIGSRRTPDAILEVMTNLAAKLSERGFILRSGGAKGADTAFEAGANNKIIYYINQFTINGKDEYRYNPENLKEARIKMVYHEIHPAWQYLKEYAKELHTRNVFQVLGENLNEPSKFVICWTPDGAETVTECSRVTGGTGTAIKLADTYNIPVFNLRKESTMERIKVFLGS